MSHKHPGFMEICTWDCVESHAAFTPDQAVRLKRESSHSF